MRNKYISKQSNMLLLYFNEKEKKCFSNSEASFALPESNESALKELLSDMAKRGLLMRLKKGLYYIIPYELEADSFMPDWHLLAKHLVREAEHYIGYYSFITMKNIFLDLKKYGLIVFIK